MRLVIDTFVQMEARVRILRNRCDKRSRVESQGKASGTSSIGPPLTKLILFGGQGCDEDRPRGIAANARGQKIQHFVFSTVGCAGTNIMDTTENKVPRVTHL